MRNLAKRGERTRDKEVKNTVENKGKPHTIIVTVHILGKLYTGNMHETTSVDVTVCHKRVEGHDAHP